METFRAFFLFESRRFIGKRNLFLIFVLLFFLLYFVQTGVSQYETVLDENVEFKKVEEIKVKGYLTYTQYAMQGFRMLFAPSPISVFFGNAGNGSGLTSFLDNGSRLKIYNSLKGKHGFVVKRFGFTDFSGIILYFGSLLVLLFGFESFHHKEYLKFLSSISNYRKIFLYIMVSRVILLMLTIMLLLGISLLLVVANQLNLSANDYSQFLNFCLSTLLMALIFFALGTVTSTMKSRVGGLMSMTLMWFVLVFFIPAAIQAIVAERAEKITPTVQLEFQKLSKALDFERRAINREGIIDRKKKMDTVAERRLIESFWNNEYKAIQKMEAEMQSQMKNNIEFYQGLSVIFPSTFYTSTTDEISSKGYDNLIEFYKAANDLQKGFGRYYINQIYYFSNYSKVKSFIKGDENVYYAHSTVPVSFWYGVGINLIYLFLLMWLSYSRYKLAIFGFNEDWQEGLKNPKLLLEEGELRPFYVEDQRFAHQMYNLLSGQNRVFKENGFGDKIYIGNRDIVMEPQVQDFLYLCHLREVPGDIKAGALVKLIVRSLGARKKAKGESGRTPTVSSYRMPPKLEYADKTISQLTRREQEALMLSLLRHETRPIYFLNDIGNGYSINFVLQLKKQMEILGREGALVIFLTSDYQPRVKSLRQEETFYNHTRWKDVVGSLEGIADEPDDENDHQEK